MVHLNSHGVMCFSVISETHRVFFLFLLFLSALNGETQTRLRTLRLAYEDVLTRDDTTQLTERWEKLLGTMSSSGAAEVLPQIKEALIEGKPGA